MDALRGVRSALLISRSRPTDRSLCAWAFASWLLSAQGFDLRFQLREGLPPAGLLTELLIAERFLGHRQFSETNQDLCS